MNSLIILIISTKGVAVIEIIFLLLIAAIIGFLTAWLFQKSKYEKKIMVKEDEINNLKTKLLDIEEHNNNLKANLKSDEIEIGRLQLEIKTLKNYDFKKSVFLLNEKDEKANFISTHKGSLNFKSFGSASITEKDDLQMINGIGAYTEEGLNSLAIFTFLQISKFTAKDIADIEEAIIYFSGRIVRDEWVSQARELVRKEERRAELFKRINDRKTHIYYDRIGVAHKEIADDLTLINGIGRWTQEKLNMLDIYTFRQISNFTKEDVKTVTEAIEYFQGRIERDEWIEQAHELIKIAGKKTELLKRIRERKDSIYFDKSGIAHKYQANNLTLITGISLWIEERLNALNITTFEQISKLTSVDIETITEILEITPGHIHWDSWIAQAKELAKPKIIIKE